MKDKGEGGGNMYYCTILVEHTNLRSTQTLADSDNGVWMTKLVGWFLCTCPFRERKLDDEVGCRPTELACKEDWMRRLVKEAR